MRSSSPIISVGFLKLFVHTISITLSGDYVSLTPHARYIPFLIGRQARVDIRLEIIILRECFKRECEKV